MPFGLPANSRRRPLFGSSICLAAIRAEGNASEMPQLPHIIFMSTTTIKPWVESVILHPGVLSPDFSEDIFALDLGPLADGNKNVPAVYRDPEQFFRASYLTNGLKSLLQDVLSRLSGGAGNRVLKLITPFGGGKSHTLASLFHSARSRKALDIIPEGKPLPKPGKVNTAVFDGQFFSPANGKDFPDGKGKANTLWGWIAWSLRGAEGYKILRKDDEARVAPGGDDILKLLGDAPNLILLDEVLEYLISAGGIKVLDTTLRDETLSFLKRLTVAVGNTPNSVLVFSLQSSKRESLDYINLLQTIDHLAARKDQRREPVEGDEVLRVIQRRLLGAMPTEADSTPAATAYQEVVTQMRRAYARTPAEQQQAEQEGVELRDRIRAAYPFHPALIDLMRERWAAIPDFQRTRGALRFLAVCLRTAHTAEKSREVFGPGDVPLHDPAVRLAFFKEVGQQSDFQACLEHDFVGANARTRRIDERRAKEFPAEALKRPATRIATTILMYSFGGLRREDANETEMLPPGITEADLLAICVAPSLDSTTILACLKELKEQCLYLHFDGVRYCFKKDPNVTLLVEQEADVVARDEDLVRDKIREMLEARLAGHNIYLAGQVRRRAGQRPAISCRLHAPRIRRGKQSRTTSHRQRHSGEIRRQAAFLPQWAWSGRAHSRPDRSVAPRGSLLARHRAREDKGQAAQPDRRTKGPVARARIHGEGRRRVCVIEALHGGLASQAQWLRNRHRTGFGRRQAVADDVEREKGGAHPRARHGAFDPSAEARLRHRDPRQSRGVLQTWRRHAAKARHNHRRNRQRLLFVPWIHAPDFGKGRGQSHCSRCGETCFWLYQRRRTYAWGRWKIPDRAREGALR
jgi:hypothetical protein